MQGYHPVWKYVNDKTCLGRDTDIFVFEEMSAGKEYKDLEGRMEYVGRYRNRSCLLYTLTLPTNREV